MVLKATAPIGRAPGSAASQGSIILPEEHCENLCSGLSDEWSGQ